MWRVVAALALAGCGIPEEAYQAKVVEVDRLKRALDEVTRRAAKQAAERAHCDASLASEEADFGAHLQELGEVLHGARQKLDAQHRALENGRCTDEEVERRARALCSAAPAGAVEPAPPVEPVEPVAPVEPLAP